MKNPEGFLKHKASSFRGCVLDGECSQLILYSFVNSRLRVGSNAEISVAAVPEIKNVVYRISAH